MLSAQQDAGYIDVEMRLPAVERKIDERKGLRDAGVVDDNVAASPLAVDRFERLGNRSRTADIQQQRCSCHPGSRQLVRLGARLLLIDVADQHLHAVVRKLVCDRRSDTLRGTRDERNPACLLR